MTPENPAAMSFLLNRRSRPAKLLRPPVPSKEELGVLLTAAARSPDHGKLEPWRFIVLERKAILRLGNLIEPCGQRLGRTEEDIAKARASYEDAHLIVAVIEVQKPADKIPPVEQTYSAGAVCLALLNAALASGWGANWLSGWASHDRTFVEDGLGLDASERVAGMIHMGTAQSAPPERPRPDMDAITTWVSE